MKKFLALLLAAMMLLSCTAAMAENIDSITNGSATWLDGEQGTSDTNGDADFDVRVENVRYTDGLDKFGKEGEAATEIWLQVDATGQIDVTVPLVLVFQTNIDGGDATSPSEYKITNHSSADLVVTKIATTKVAKEDKKQPMDMVAWSTTDMGEDKYAVQIKEIGGKLGSLNQDTFDLYLAGNAGAVHANSAIKGGLFELLKAPKDDYTTGTETKLAVEMKTGRLSFVTSRNDDDTMNTDKGIQLMTITYTVAIDTSDAYGEAITTEATMTTSPLSGDASESSHTKIEEKTSSGAVEDTNVDD